MTDPIDGIIRRCLKNWAVQRHPPANIRARIILLAGSPTPRLELGALRTQANSPKHIPSTYSRPVSVWGIGPLNQTMLWDFDLTLIPLRHFP